MTVAKLSRALEKGGSLTSKQTDSDSAGVRNIWDSKVKEKLLKYGPSMIGQQSYTRDGWEGIWTAIVCDRYLEIQVSKENFVGIQQVIGGIVDELLEGGSSPGSSILTGLKGLPL
jgi:hypothetical protein